MSCDENSDVKFCRSQNSSQFGKNTEEIKTSGPQELKEKLTAMAVMTGDNGIPLAEYVRNVLIAHVYGHDLIMRKNANK